jgi:hypothetical protein
MFKHFIIGILIIKIDEGGKLMGKFVEEKAIIETYLDNYVKTTNDFSRFIEGSPNFVTYYSKDVQASTEDMTLGGVLEVIGSESPIKFNKIENFPIYNMEEVSPNLEFGDDTGLDTTVESTAIILPNTIKPLPNDYFMVNYLNKNYLFRVSNVEINNIHNRVYYKISYYLSNSDVNILEERQLTDSYKVVYENLGKEAKSVIKESDFLLLNNLDDVYAKLRDFYIKFFYNKDYNTFLYKDRMYDNLLMKFIANNSLFIKTRTFLKNIKIESLLKEDMDAFFIYESSLYSALENRDTDELSNLFYVPRIITDKSSIFALFRNKYEVNEMVYTNDESLDPYPLFGSDFVEKIQNRELYESTDGHEFQIKNFIIQFLNNTLIKEDLVSYIINKNPRMSLANYILIPCVLFIIKEIENDILNK